MEERKRKFPVFFHFLFRASPFQVQMCKSIDATAEYRLLLNKDITRGERDYLVYPLEMMQFFFDKKKKAGTFYSLFYCIMHKVYIKKRGATRAAAKSSLWCFAFFVLTMNSDDISGEIGLGGVHHMCLHNWLQQSFCSFSILYLPKPNK